MKLIFSGKEVKEVLLWQDDDEFWHWEVTDLEDTKHGLWTPPTARTLEQAIESLQESLEGRR